MFRCYVPVFSSNAMYQVKYFILAKNLAHLILISHFRDILTLKQISTLSLKNKIQNYQDMACLFSLLFLG